MHVARCYRYPVKGMTAEPLPGLYVTQGGAVGGDRVLGFLRADAGEPDYRFSGGDWWRKQRFAALVNAPGMARIVAHYEPVHRHLALHHGTRLLAQGEIAEDGVRAQLGDAVEAFLASPDGGAEATGPLRLVGNGVSPNFHDRGPRHVSIVSAASIAALAEAVGAPVDERRFRMNLVLEGVSAWAELGWVGQVVRVGGVTFEVSGPVVRCAATHANPATGDRDMDVLGALTARFGHEQPTMGVIAVARTAGEIRAGDEVTPVA